ncbi:unnamed protein product [Angiostrongylus costaricensis]|uniref:GYF domain-containing protein n=1 Tax=Angiostrongylus costaricensis TaxID=334426 RepID=A0A0R3PZQ0_ANGCS|nr:unnamed protein product [Angiostrongylus costaricensis]
MTTSVSKEDSVDFRLWELCSVATEKDDGYEEDGEQTVSKWMLGFEYVGEDIGDLDDEDEAISFSLMGEC